LRISASTSEIHICRPANDEGIVNTLLQRADEIYRTAQSGTEDCDMAILVHPDGAISMVEGTGWAAAPMRQHHGAAAVYRVNRTGRRVQVEASSREHHCELGGSMAQALPLFSDLPRYLLA
jgi:hypothetical protein